MKILLAATLILSMTASAAVKVEKTAWKGWPNCYRISNGEVELIVTTDVGPRIMRYAFIGGPNIFKEYAEQLGKTGEKEWMGRGGHRLWIAPEDAKLSYPADNFPVKIDTKGGIVTLTAPVEPETGLEKQITVKLAPSGTAVEVDHRIRNTKKVPVEWAAWALTQMAQNGVGITGFPPRGTHPQVLAPTNPLVMFAFTDLSDKRWQFTKKYMLLRQDPRNPVPQKLGHFNPNTWGAYLLNGELFIKKYKASEPSRHPDFGSSYETFTNGDMLELETIGPLTKLAPGASLNHVENWSLHKNVNITSFTDEALDKILLPLVGK